MVFGKCLPKRKINQKLGKGGNHKEWVLEEWGAGDWVPMGNVAVLNAIT